MPTATPVDDGQPRTKKKRSRKKNELSPARYVVMVRVVKLWRVWIKPNGDQAIASSLAKAESLRKECLRYYESFLFDRNKEKDAKGITYEEIEIFKMF